MVDDAAPAPWAWPSICQQKGLSRAGTPWDPGSDHPDPDEEAARAVARRCMVWHEAPRTAAAAGIPRPSRGDVTWLHAAWPDLCRAHRVPRPEEWIEQE